MELYHFIREQYGWVLQLWFFGFGACVGSFLNVCVLRIPLGKSIVTPGSHCACGAPIPFYRNIPIFTWFILRGRAPCCGRRFSFRYPLVEAVTAGVFLWLWVALPPARALPGMVFFALLLMGSLMDLDHMILPDATTIGGMFAGLAFAVALPQMYDLPVTTWNFADAGASVSLALVGIGVGAGLVYWFGEFGRFFLKKEAMGYGDVLLMGCVGAFCGWQGALMALFGGGLLASVVVLPLKAFAYLAPRRAAAPPDSAVETPVSAAAEAPPEPLERRHFQLRPVLVIAAALGAGYELWQERAALLVWPGLALLAALLAGALLRRSRLILDEAWLLLAVVLGVLLSCIWPRMHLVTLTDVWVVDATRSLVLAAAAAIVSAALALWLRELGNLARRAEVANEGHTLLAGGLGAFCGWRAALLGLAAAAAANLAQGCWQLARGRGRPRPSAAENALAPADDVALADGPAPLDLSHIPFGPWLALGGFLYYASPALHAWTLAYFSQAQNIIFNFNPPR